MVCTTILLIAAADAIAVLVIFQELLKIALAAIPLHLLQVRLAINSLV